jgi:hypothetical protein
MHLVTLLHLLPGPGGNRRWAVGSLGVPRTGIYPTIIFSARLASHQISRTGIEIRMLFSNVEASSLMSFARARRGIQYLLLFTHRSHEHHSKPSHALNKKSK